MLKGHAVPGWSRQPPQAALLAAVFLCSSAVVLSGYGPGLPDAVRPVVKLALPALWLLLAWAAGRTPAFHTYRSVLLAFFAVSLGLLIAWLIGAWPLQKLGLATDSLPGMVVAKLAEAIPIVASILIVNRLEGKSLADLHLRRGRLGVGLMGGAAIGLLLSSIFLLMGGRQALAYAGPSRLLAALPYLLVFALANGFMEELWFRGLYLNRFEGLMSPWSALLLSTLAFGMLHLAADYAGGQLGQLLASTLLLGFTCGWVVQSTRTLWGAVLAHAVGDVLVLLGFFWTLL